MAVFSQPREIVFTRMTKDDGLASSRIHSIIKDHQGYYWISSANGLQRFDGKRMVNFQHDPNDSSSLPNNMVLHLKEDHKKRLWLNIAGNPYIYNAVDRTFRKIPVNFPGKETFGITSFFEDCKGLFWMMVTDTDPFVLDTLKNVFIPYTQIWPRAPARILYVMDDTSTGYYWLITVKGLMIYNPKTNEYYNNSYNPIGLRCFKDSLLLNPTGSYHKDFNDVLWMQFWGPTGGWMQYKYDIKKDELLPANVHNQLWGFLTDHSGTTWSYGYYLGYYDKNNGAAVPILPKKNSLYGIDFNEIFSMTEDAENNIWVITNLGVYSFNLQRQYFSTANSTWSYKLKKQIDGNTNGFVETKDGHFILLSWGGDALCFYDSSFTQVPGLYGYNPASIKNKDYDYMLTWCGLQDKQGFVWIGCQHGRIIKLDPATNKVSFVHPPEFEDHTIRSIAEDKNGNIWFGTQNNIVVKWTRSTNTYKQVIPFSKEKYMLGWVISIQPGFDNDLWVGTISGGMLHIDLATDKVTEQFLEDKNRNNSISRSKVNGIVMVNADTVAIATDAGIDLFDWRRRRFTHLGIKDGLPSEGVISMVKDNWNNIWFSSVDGISKIHLPDKAVNNYGFADGIMERDFQMGGAIALRNNRILFGNTSGFVSFDPNHIINDRVVPSDVTITGFKIFDRNLSVDSLFEKNKKVNLSYSENYITIQFASLSNIMGNHPNYYYMLDGIDKDWIKATDNQEAIYTYLPPGTYSFKIRCVSKDGAASRNITSFIIDVHPPFWRTWWFVTLLLSAVIGVAYYIYLLQARRRNEREVIRYRIARDLHDDMGSTLSTINILSSMAKSKLHVDEIRASEYINKIGDNSQRMMEAMDDIVWAIKPDNDSMQKILARMREFATSVLEAKDIDIQFSADEKVNDVKLNMEQRRDFFLVFKEAVNNVAKYSKSHQAIIQIAVRQHRLVLMIKDDGVGFDVNSADNGNGLGNMQKRAMSLKGRLQIQSKPGEGTTVILNIPVR